MWWQAHANSLSRATHNATPGLGWEVAAAALCSPTFAVAAWVPWKDGLAAASPNEHTACCTAAAPQVYRNFIEAVDAIDNGVGQYAVPSGTAPLYLNNTTLSSRVGALIPRWNQPSDDETLYRQVRARQRADRG